MIVSTQVEAWMRPIAVWVIGSLLMGGNLSCSVNILQSFSNTKTNGALYVNALEAVNSGDYNGALSNIAQMTGSYASSAQVLELKASAYGGLCGFQFVPFVTALGGIGSTLLFPFLLQTFDAGVASNIDNCVFAQNTIESIGPIAARSTDENFFLATIALAKIGNILSFYADPAHHGVGTAGFDPCAVGATRASGQITDSDAREIGVGISLAATNLAAVASQVQLGTGSLTTINNVCTLLGGMNFCAVTDPTLLTTNEVLGVRSLVKESVDIGLGTNCTGNVTTCFCP
jgi:hypothetical protein